MFLIILVWSYLKMGQFFPGVFKVSSAFHDWKLELVDSLLDLLRSHLSME